MIMDTLEFPRWERGDGPTIIVLHGLFGEPGNWTTVFNELSKDYHVVVMDLPLFHPSPVEPTIEALADYVIAFMDASGIERAFFMGNSLGGHIALSIALHFPDHVAGLVLTGSSGLFERGFERSVPRRPTHEWIREKVREVFYDERNVPLATVSKLANLFQDRKNFRRVLSLAKSAKHNHLGDVLHQIDVPTLLVWGKQDQITPLEVAVEFFEKIENSRLVLLDECCHAPMMEHPGPFSSIVYGFLQEQVA